MNPSFAGRADAAFFVWTAVRGATPDVVFRSYSCIDPDASIVFAIGFASLVSEDFKDFLSCADHRGPDLLRLHGRHVVDVGAEQSSCGAHLLEQARPLGPDRGRERLPPFLDFRLPTPQECAPLRG